MTNVSINNEYGNPVTTPSPIPPNAVVVNQQTPKIVLKPNQYKSSPVCVTCTSCGENIITITSEEFNFCACCLCFASLGVICLCVQSCRGKDFYFYDVTHHCPRCHAIIGTYTPC